MKPLFDRIARRLDQHSEAGMATTEYALVTVAAAAFAAVLVAIIKSERVRELLFGIVESALG
jgi:hypothetical protein